MQIQMLSLVKLTDVIELTLSVANKRQSISLTFFFDGEIRSGLLACINILSRVIH